MIVIQSTCRWTELLKFGVRAQYPINVRCRWCIRISLNVHMHKESISVSHWFQLSNDDVTRLQQLCKAPYFFEIILVI